MINPLSMLQTIGAGVAIAVLVGGIQQIRVHNAHEDLKDEKALHETCKTNYTIAHANELVCEAAHAARNAQIDADAANGIAAETAAQKASDDALAKAKERQRAAAALGHGPGVLNDFMKGAVQ